MADFLNKTFVAANGTAVTTHDSSWVATNNASENTGVATIINNRVSAVGGNGRAMVMNTATPPSADYEVVLYLRKGSGEDGQIFAVARYRASGAANTPSGYAFSFSDYNYAKILKYWGGGVDTLVPATYITNIPTGTEFAIRVRVQGNTISGFFNEDTSPFLTFTDTVDPITVPGNAAFTTWVNNGDSGIATITGAVARDIPSGALTISPPVTTNSQTFFIPTITQLPLGTLVQPPRINNTQTFYNASVSKMPDGARGQWIVDNTGPIGGSYAGILYNDVQLPADANKWFHFVITTPPSTGTLNINPDGTFTFMGPQPETMYYQLYVDNVAVGSPQLVTLYTQGEPQTLSPGLLTNSQTFYSPTIVRGTRVLQPPVMASTNSFYSPVVTPVGTIIVAPPLTVNTSTIFAPVVTASGAISISPPRITNNQTFFSARIIGGDQPVSSGKENQRIGIKMSIGL